jgi:hypothetical protein
MDSAHELGPQPRRIGRHGRSCIAQRSRVLHWLRPRISCVTPMNDMPPDRLSADSSSPFYNAEMLERGVGIRFKGAEKNNVEEYCVSEGWIRVAAGTAKDRNGNPMTIKLKGEVEAYFRRGPSVEKSADQE